MRFRVLKTADFIDWYKRLDSTTQIAIDARVERLVSEGHYDLVNRFDEITELKWKNGLRVYTAVQIPHLILLFGGNKNGQSKDIRRAKRLLSKIG